MLLLCYVWMAQPRKSTSSPYSISGGRTTCRIQTPATGELKVDPDIVLKAKKFNLVINFFYSSFSNANAEYGNARSASVKGYILSQTNGSAIVTRGDFSQYPFTVVGASGGIATYIAQGSTGQTTTLSFDGTLFTEYFANGTQFLYKHFAGNSSSTYSLYLVQDASGVAQTYSYDSTGLLQNITVPGGRLVSFLYGSGTPTSLLSTVQDWSGRLWTLLYDSNRNLTTMTTPLGCSTQYTYSLAGTANTLMLYTIQNPQGFSTSYLYDNQGRVTTMTAGTAVWKWTFTDDGTQKQAVMTSPSGARTTYHYDENTGVPTATDHPEGYTSTLIYTNRLKTSETIPTKTVER